MSLMPQASCRLISPVCGALGWAVPACKPKKLASRRAVQQRSIQLDLAVQNISITQSKAACRQKERRSPTILGEDCIAKQEQDRRQSW